MGPNAGRKKFAKTGPAVGKKNVRKGQLIHRRIGVDGLKNKGGRSAIWPEQYWRVVGQGKSGKGKLKASTWGGKKKGREARTHTQSQ